MADTTDPVAKLNDMIRGIQQVMLTTVRSNGTVHCCPMAPHAVEPDGTLWFFAGNYSEKVEALKTDPRVNVAYADPASGRYVSVAGNSELVRDHLRAQALWKDEYKAWFPKGVSDPDLILLKVDIREVEYWDKSSNRMMRLNGF
jgi:general stress protein 26